MAAADTTGPHPANRTRTRLAVATVAAAVAVVGALGLLARAELRADHADRLPVTADEALPACDNATFDTFPCREATLDRSRTTFTGTDGRPHTRCTVVITGLDSTRLTCRDGYVEVDPGPVGGSGEAPIEPPVTGAGGQ